MFFDPPAVSWLTRPGLFITATDTGVGKTVVTCAIAWALRRQMKSRHLKEPTIAACKPMASGCLIQDGRLVSSDAQALACFCNSSLPLEVINPVRYVPPLSPAAAARTTDHPVDFAAIAQSLKTLNDHGDALLIEGVGGLMVPIDHANPRTTLLDLAAELGYPVLVVCRAMLGTLNHTAMTVALLRQAGCRVAGLVVNGDQTGMTPNDQAEDISLQTNRQWLMEMNNLPILAAIPRCLPETVRPEQGQIPDAILQAVAMTDWVSVLSRPEPSRR